MATNASRQPTNDLRPGRRRWRVGAGIVAGVVVVWTAFVFVRLLSLHSEVHDLRSQLHALRAEANSATAPFASTKGDEELARIAQRLDQAHAVAARMHAQLGDLPLALVRHTPWIGRQIQSARTLSLAVAHVTSPAAELVKDIQAATTTSSLGKDTLEVLVSTNTALSRARQRIDAVGDLGPTTGLIGPVRSARAEVATDLTDLKAGLAQAATVLTGLTHMLQGPRAYLLVAAGNSEMVAGSGRFLEIGWMRFNAGTEQVSGLHDANTASNFVPPGAVKVADADLVHRWGWLDPGTMWTTLGTTPRFPATAPVASQMWAYQTKQPNDGVVVIDIDALVGIVKATGNLQFQGQTYTPERLRDYLEYEQYFTVDNDARQQREQQLTGAVVQSIRETSIHPLQLFAALRQAVLGRHIYGWSSDPSEEAFWTAAHADGAVGPQSILPSVINMDGKLDHFLHVQITPSAVKTTSGYQVDLAVYLHNTVTRDAPAYMTSTSTSFGVEAGTYVGIVSLDLPEAATDVEAQGQPAAFGRDGRSQLTSSWVVIPPGRSMTTVVRFELPASEATVQVLPSSRDPEVQWQIGTRVQTDDTGFSLNIPDLPVTPGTVPGLLDLHTPQLISAELQRLTQRLGPVNAAAFSGLVAGFIPGGQKSVATVLGPESPSLSGALKEIGLAGFLMDMSELYALEVAP